MTEDHADARTTTIHIIKDNELRLAKVRRQPEDLFHSLHLVHDEIGVTSEAARALGQREVASVLDPDLSVTNRQLDQLKLLAIIIERREEPRGYPRATSEGRRLFR